MLTSDMVAFNNSNRVVSIVIPGNFSEIRVHRDGIAARSFVKIKAGVSHNFLTVANRVSCSYKNRNSFEKKYDVLIEKHTACVKIKKKNKYKKVVIENIGKYKNENLIPGIIETFK